MRPDIVEKLQTIRKRLSEQEGEAWGPESAVDTDHQDGAAGEGGAENVSDINDTFIDYMLSIAGSVEDEFEIDSEGAVDFVFDIADQLAADGTLPVIPDENDLAGTAEWLGKAKSLGFGEMVLSILDAQANGEDSESDDEEE